MGSKVTDEVRFEASVDLIGSTTLIRIPTEASTALPSRGQVNVRGSINGHDFATVVEPDGLRGHWIRIDPRLEKEAGLDEGDPVTVTLEPAGDWPEPEIPADLAAALKTAPGDVQDRWQDITPMARWEWVRWVNATANPSTRARRIEVSISKLEGGKRRPCCFDLSSCTDPSVSKSGKLVADTDR